MSNTCSLRQTDESGVDTSARGCDGVIVWRNPAFLPRAALVSDVRHAPPAASGHDILDVAANLDVDYGRTAVVDGASAPLLQGSLAQGSVQTRSSGPDEMLFTTESGSAMLLRVSNTFYPGWTATIDGRPTRIHRVNWFGMGVYTPPGTHDVRFRFEAPGWRVGLAITMVALLAWSVAMVLLRITGRSRAL